MQRQNVVRFVLSAIFIGSGILTACSPAPATIATATPASPVRLQVSWMPDAEFSGFYVASENGFYKNENLDFTLDGGGIDKAGNYIDPVARVTSGLDDFGIIDGSTLIASRAGGAPVVAIASIYQRHPLAFTSLAEKKIARPQDLVGKTVHITSSDQATFKALLVSQKIDPSQVNIQERTDLTITPLLDGKADVINGWVTNEVIDLKMAGRKVNTILLSDYGIDTYSDVLFTTEAMIEKHPDVVLRFLRASLKGMQTAIDSPALAAALAQKAATGVSLERMTLSMNANVPLLKPANSQPGMMNEAAWAFTYQILIDQKVLTSPMNVKTVYTMDFLNQIYGKK
jgi:NitT/TauT family transport system substrate-binding protein